MTKNLFLLVLPSPAFHLLLSWKDKDQKINNGNNTAAFSLWFHFPFLSIFQNIFCRHTGGLMWIRACRSSRNAQISVVQSTFPLCEELGEPLAVLAVAWGEGQEIWEGILYIKTFPGFQNTPTGINSCQWVTGQQVEKHLMCNYRKTAQRAVFSDCVDTLNLQLAVTAVWPYLTNN